MVLIYLQLSFRYLNILKMSCSRESALWTEVVLNARDLVSVTKVWLDPIFCM